MEHYKIRPTQPEDIGTVLAMYDHSRSLMRAAGNTVQWDGYPTADDVQADIAAGTSRLVLSDGSPVGTFALVSGIEPTYTFIDHGRWIDTATPYVTIHRVAKSPEGHGIAHLAFQMAKQQFTHLRADTYRDNHLMLHLLSKEDFVECGTIYMDDGSPRQAFEWWRWDEVETSLQRFVSEDILPRYDHFDAAHRRNHALRVIARAMVLFRHLRAEISAPTVPTASLIPEMIYTAAAMHDLGLCAGRERHHLVSGVLIRTCKPLHHWFDDKQIEAIAQAAEDHRASASSPPRSWIGRLIAEADRDIEPETIVRRTVEYGLSHYPELNREGHWQRTLQHLHEKYAEGGYIKLWLNNSPNEQPLAELRDLINNEPRLRQVFEKYFKP